MLLSLMRKHAKSWLIKLLIGIIAVVFIFYFGYSFSSRESAKIAEVNGEIISMQEYQKAYRDLLAQYQREYKTVWNDNLIKTFGLKDMALENLINKKIMSQEARKIGLEVTDQEIRDKIMGYPAFQFMGRFDENRYRTLLADNYMKPEDFEESISMDLLQQKLRHFLISFLPASEQEVREQYRFYNQQVKIAFVKFLPEEFKDSIKVEPDLMEKYFEDHREDYRIPDKVKIAYLMIGPDKFKDQVTIDDMDIEAFYDDNQKMFREEKEVRASHILFQLDPEASPEDEKRVRDKANEVLEKARAGEDFSELAKKYSEGPTKDKGGDLGFFTRGRMIKPFEEAVFNMEKGEISDLVRTDFGYHIIKLVDIKEEKLRGLEEVREEISKILIRNGSMDLANERGLSLLDQMPYDVDLIQYGKEHEAQVELTDFFAQDDPIPVIGGDDKFRQAIFSMGDKEVSDLIEFEDNFYIVQLIERKLSYLPGINEVNDQVKNDFMEYLTREKAKSAAEDYLVRLKKSGDWDGQAKAGGREKEVTEFFTRRGFPEKIGFAEGLLEEAFKLTRDNPYPDKVFENEIGAFVIGWEDEKEIDEAKYLEEKERYADSITYTKQQIIFTTWLERLKQNAEIDRSPFEKLE